MFTNRNSIVERMAFKKTLMTVLSYIGILALFALAFFLIKYIEGNDGEAYIFFAFEAIFMGVSAFTAQFIPNERQETLNFFKIGTLSYVLYNLLLDTIVIVGTSGESVPTTITVVMTILTYSRIVIPLGLIVWQGKKWTFLTGLRKNKKDAIAHYKNHGNDGMM